MPNELIWYWEKRKERFDVVLFQTCFKMVLRKVSSGNFLFPNPN
jgi:hypothetical protein